MLPFLPPPYPDELLYSICARYHLFNASSSQKQTLFDLFGSPCASAVYDLPNRLSELSLQLPPGSLNTPERLLRLHTMFPLYEPFLPKRRAQAVASKMIGTGRGGAIHNSIGIMASSVPALKTLRFCPDCIGEESALFGEPYWHRTHQVPGVLACHRHGSLLENSDVIVTSGANKHYFISAYHGARIATDPTTKPCHIPEHSTTLAAMAYDLLNSTYPVLGLRTLQRSYIRRLRELGLATVGSRVSQRGFIAQFTSFYGNEFLVKVGCQLDPPSQDNWLTCMVRHPRKASHPLRHLLLIHFLGISLDDFFNCKYGYHPFGRGPWPCLNPVAEHFRRPVVSICTVGRNSETGAPTGTFACSCGFIYSRSGPDRCREDRYKFSRVISRGPLWEGELLRLAEDEGMSIRFTAKLLNVDPKTVINHLNRILLGRPASKPEKTDVAAVEAHRNEWHQLMVDNPLLSRKELRQIKPAVYIWLYRHDRQWLFCNPFFIKSNCMPHARVDWDARDRWVAKAVRQAVTTLRQQQDNRRNVTISQLGKMTGCLDLLQKHLDKLPETKAVIVSVHEAFLREGK